MRKDLTGKVFGRWEVIAPAGVDKHRNRRWHCRCQCGNEKDVPTSSLTCGNSKSCGCLQIEASRNGIAPGTLFGRLRVIEFAGTRRQRSLYRCLCSCGKETIVQSHRLHQGITRSCGCLRKTHGMSGTSEYAKLQYRIRRARKMNAEGSHTIEDVRALFEQQEGLCYYCNKNLPPYHIEHKIPLARGGSDYKENICLACPTCNYRKRTKTDEEFFELMSYKKV